MFLRSLVACLSLSATLVPSAVYAAHAASCAKPHFSDVGWTSITATTQIANQILAGLGYKPNITVLSVAVTFKSLENGDIDVFLGNWMPLQEPSQAPLVKAGKIDAVTIKRATPASVLRLQRPPMTPGSRPMPTSPSSRTSSMASSMASNPAAAPTAPSRR